MPSARIRQCGGVVSLRGHGQTVRFNAFDIQQLGARQILSDWHLKDNLTFMQQIGAVK